MTKLTTHCLDTFSGKPAKGIKVDVYLVSEKREKINSTILNNNGRSDKPLVEGTNFKEGQYELVFFVCNIVLIIDLVSCERLGLIDHHTYL